MFSVKADSFTDVIKPLHFLSQIFGLTSFTIIKNKEQKYHVVITIFNVMCIFLLNCWSVIIILRLTFYETIWDLNCGYLPKFLENNSRMILVALTLIITFSCWWHFIMKEKFVVLLELMKEVDLLLIELDSPINHLKQKTFLIPFLVCIKILHFAEAGGAILMSEETSFFKVSFFSIMGDFIGSECYVMLGSQFMFLMWAIKCRYQQTNNYLKKIHFEKLSNNFELKAENLKKLSILHDKLIDIADIASLCYGIPVRVIFILLKANNTFVFVF